MKNKLLFIVLHVVAWVVFLSLLTILVPKPPQMDPVLSVLIPDLFFIFFFYFNFYFLIPEFFIPRKYVVYAIVCLGCLVLTMAVPSIIFQISETITPPFSDFHHVPPPDFGIRDMNEPPGRMRLFKPEFGYTIFVFLFLLTLSIGIRVIMQWKQAEKEKVNAELAFLKAQINPHFLFNTLNSIYMMAINKMDRTPEAIEMFSDMMRFVIYETKHDWVPLSREVEYIRNYIELQKMRLSPAVTVSFHPEGDLLSQKIAPLILMPFIENAFKHGISTEKDSFIDITLTVEQTTLHLMVKNTKFGYLYTPKESSQLGIDNTIKRLQMIYPGKYTLDIRDDETVYIVSLILELK